MKRLILKVKDKAKARELGDFCNVVFVSKFVNVVGVEISQENICKLSKNDNIISFKESEEGTFQPRLLTL